MKNKNTDFGIRPHFVFNSLNSVAGLISESPSQAETALYNLAGLLRAGLSDPDQLVTFRQELATVEKYLYLEKIRFGDRLKVTQEIDSNALDARIPVFLLLPLVESVVYNSIETRLGGGDIALQARTEEQQIIIKITSPPAATSAHHRPGSESVEQRLKKRIFARYGEHGLFDSWETNNTFHIEIRLPLSNNYQ